jgi:chemotaxis protein histidine kinase CheA
VTADRSWADDPELIATFRAEVEERLAGLRAGLLSLEAAASPRPLLIALFRDAHTVKGSARMLGLDAIVRVAHRCEELLGLFRDGRFVIRRDLVDVLLAALGVIADALPGANPAVSESDVAVMIAALDAAIAGDEPVRTPGRTPMPEPPPAEVDSPVVPASRGVDLIRVPSQRVHGLLDVVGELGYEMRRAQRPTHDVSVITRAHRQAVRRLDEALAAGPVSADTLRAAVISLRDLDDRLEVAARELRDLVEDGLDRLDRLRDTTLGFAMVPAHRLLAGFTGLVREVAHATGKEVGLSIAGEDVELDSRVLDRVADALRHLVINAVDHGCETPAERVAAGKSAQATICLGVRASGSTIVIEVADDGRGVDEQRLRESAVRSGHLAADASVTGPALLSLLFAAGLSTRPEVTETSGRGVGLDVVWRAVEALGGTVAVETQPGLGTCFTVTLPVTVGVQHCLIAGVGSERYAIPVSAVVETIGLAHRERFDIAGFPAIRRAGDMVPLVDLGRALGVTGPRNPRAAIVLRGAGGVGELAWVVDRLEGERELVVKELGGFLGRPRTMSGATFDDDGRVVFLLDVRELTIHHHNPHPWGDDPLIRTDIDSGSVSRPRILVVEDSSGIRELERTILEWAGYEVVTCADGLDGAARLSGPPVDLVISDVEMPGMDGLALTRAIRRTRGWEDVPVVMMTSRGADDDRRAGFDAGATAYLLKNCFDQHELVSTVRRLVGR